MSKSACFLKYFILILSIFHIKQIHCSVNSDPLVSEELINACHKYDTATVAELIKSGININEVDPTGLTLIEYAVSFAILKIEEKNLEKKQKRKALADKGIYTSRIFTDGLDGEPIRFIEFLIAKGAIITPAAKALATESNLERVLRVLNLID